jgi:hypothetical protein
MFSATFFTEAKIWSKPICPPIGRDSSMNIEYLSPFDKIIFIGLTRQLQSF